MKITRLRLVAIVCALVVVIAFGVFYFFVRQNQEAVCSGCRRFVSVLLPAYTEKHGGWYPKGAGDPMRSLALVIADEPEREQKSLVHVFTSHALTPKAEAYYAEHQTFHEDYSCYRYNEGLKIDDPSGLILLYYFKPTRWASTYARDSFNRPGRVVLTTHGDWEFITEAEFQSRQAATLALLANRKN